MRVDFPVFGRPTMATKPERKSLIDVFSHLEVGSYTNGVINSSASATDVTSSALRSPINL